MRKVNLLLLFFSALVLTNCNASRGEKDSANYQSNDREYYQLKVYTFASKEQQASTDNYLKNAYLPGAKRLGINAIGVFKPLPNQKDTTLKTIVLTPFKSIDQFLSLDDQLNEDKTYIEAGSAYINASFDQSPYSRIESILLIAFPDFPSIKPSELTTPRPERVYELRSYESPTESYFKNKVEMFNAGGEVKLFDHLDFNAVFYGEVISGTRMPNLMYMTTFTDQVSRDEHWEAFVESPEWKGLIALQKYENNVSHIDILFLYPTEYSDY